ncbi:DUF2075 domain-containing protein [Sphaerisporangium album]|uniref:DUF2075 domain-containing protein n=1 Tax=Sphaerisporangium album TaxID=509200 RepID=A0A367FR19_9ACTN|nr:DUF2075 domain-containing protein [Sphaerisporangium album]
MSPRRLVITGAPGAGKTVLAVELILGLLEDRARDTIQDGARRRAHDHAEVQTVPVRISAATLDTELPTAGAVEV